MHQFDLAKFINSHVTGREQSFFQADIESNSGALSEQIKDKSVLVIGGGGTIGSNYIKSILNYRPAKLVVIDTNENGLTELVRDIRSRKDLYVPKDFITYPVNLGDKVFEKIYQFHKPFDIVANFAAHKHVRSEKDVFSVEAMIQNNLFFAHRLLHLLEADKPQHFFCVSTDKAANPVNIMGATKKLMEEVILHYAASIKCTTARFANVAFSNGSLLDGFLYRLRYQQPFSVPADVKRYFVSPTESGEICMLASVLGETGDIFFPKLKEDELTSFLSITEKFLDAVGFEMDKCHSEEEAKEKARYILDSKQYPVYVFNSETTGEKLYEEFYTAEEIIDWDKFSGMAVAKNTINDNRSYILKVIGELEGLFSKGNIQKSDIVSILSHYLPTFEHIEKGLTLDSKM